MNGVTTFDTEHYAPSDRLTAWRDHIEASVFDVGILPFDTAGLLALSRSRSLEGMVATTFRTNQHVIERTPEASAADPRRGLYVSIMLTGEATFYRPGGSHIIREGEALLYSPAEPYVLAFSPQSQQLFLDITEECLLQRYGARPPANAVKAPILEARRQLMSTAELSALATDMGSASIPTSKMQPRIDVLLPSLFAALDASQGDGTYARAMRVLRTHSPDPDFNVATIAELSHISSRQLSRAFTAKKTTAAAELANHRVRHACELLRNPDLLLADAAHSAGFGSLSTMVRAFQRAGLGAPSSYRRRVLQGASGAVVAAG